SWVMSMVISALEWDQQVGGLAGTGAEARREFDVGEKPRGLLAGLQLHARQIDARFPGADRHHGGGHHLHAGFTVERLVDQIRHQAAEVTAHDARAERCTQDLADALADVLQVGERLSSGGVEAEVAHGHSGSPVSPPMLSMWWWPSCRISSEVKA